MKAPATNVARSLREQRAGGRSPEAMVVEPVAGEPSMVAPGEGGVALPPGALMPGDERQQRSAALHGDVMARFGGPRSDR